jgi:UDP-N-acetylglucosamine transferase subunit ALG13
MFRCPVTYVESAARLHGPSQTARLVQRLPRASLLVQGRGWGDPRWKPVPDVFEEFEAVERAEPPEPLTKALVTLGTERFPFPRAVSRLREVLAGCEVYWQTGSTVVEDDAGRLPQWVPAEELRRACREADVAVTHGGVGSILLALTEGKVPVVLPRRAADGEHIDDHQAEVCAMLAERGLVVALDPDRLTRDDLDRARSRRVVRTGARTG